MCGIAGILDWHHPPCAEAMARLVQVMRHRGPDHQATWLGGPLALGHCRLAIDQLWHRHWAMTHDSGDRLSSLAILGLWMENGPWTRGEGA